MLSSNEKCGQIDKERRMTVVNMSIKTKRNGQHFVAESKIKIKLLEKTNSHIHIIHKQHKENKRKKKMTFMKINDAKFYINLKKKKKKNNKR